MSDSIFTRIIKRELPAAIVYEDDDIIAFRDINPQAPTHVLIVPKIEIPTVNDLQPEQAELIGNMMLVAKKVAADEGIAEDGYRLVVNGGRQLRGISAAGAPDANA